MTTYLITGCGRGIGLAMTKAFLDRGARVLGSLRSNQAPIAHERFIQLTFDVRDEDAINAAALGVDEPIDVLINNPGIMEPRTTSSLEMDFTALVRSIFRVLLWFRITLTLAVLSGCQLGSMPADAQPTAVQSSDQSLAVEASAPNEDEATTGSTPVESTPVPSVSIDAIPVISTTVEASESKPVLRVGDLLAAPNAVEQSEAQQPEAGQSAAVQSEAVQSEAVQSEAVQSPKAINDEVSVESPSETRFEMGNELTIAALQAREIVGSEITFEQTLENGPNYAQYIASYLSEGNRIYGLLTVPLGDLPADGYKAVVFNHGFIPPAIYQTTERYVAYVDALARSGLVVFKIDLRGHGNSEGEASGSYFSPGYAVDAISALKSLQRLDFVDPQGIGMWGHSMAGNLVLRAMLIEPDVKAGVIWAGAVYSYDDLVRYAIDDPSASRDFFERSPGFRRGREIREFYGQPNTEVPYWRAVSLTKNLETLQAPLQLHHAVNDDVVNIGYAIDLAAVLTAENKPHEFYQYDSGGHNIGSPAFTEAMQRTIAFFLASL